MLKMEIQGKIDMIQQQELIWESHKKTGLKLKFLHRYLTSLLVQIGNIYSAKELACKSALKGIELLIDIRSDLENVMFVDSRRYVREIFSEANEEYVNNVLFNVYYGITPDEKNPYQILELEPLEEKRRRFREIGKEQKPKLKEEEYRHILSTLRFVQNDLNSLPLKLFKLNPKFKKEWADLIQSISDLVQGVERLSFVLEKDIKIATEKYNKEQQQKNVESEKKQIAQEVKKKLIKNRRQVFQQNRDHLLLALIERDGWICNHPDCQEQANLQIDHIVPLSKGGTDDLKNLQLLCHSHNATKSDKLNENWNKGAI